MEISDTLLCLFNAEVTLEDDEYVVEIPRREIENGVVTPGDIYKVALIARDESQTTGTPAAGVETEPTSDETIPPSEPQPPVEKGELRYVEIEDIGKQGDGIARVERGYVIIVPDGEVGERVKVEITEVKSNFAVGEIVEAEFA
jgi:predicted RNA-binding protein with TRAM domain